jgi:hypothetical protein
VRSLARAARYRGEVAAAQATAIRGGERLAGAFQVKLVDRRRHRRQRRVDLPALAMTRRRERTCPGTIVPMGGSPVDPGDARPPGSGENSAGHMKDRAALRRARRERMRRVLDHEQALHQPEWVRPSEGEPLWPVALAVLAAVGLQISVPSRLAVHPRLLLPALVLGLLVVLAAVKPAAARQRSVLVQLAGLLLVIIAAFANAFSAVKLVLELLHGTAGDNPTTLLGTGAAIYVTNVIVFALW